MKVDSLNNSVEPNWVRFPMVWREKVGDRVLEHTYRTLENRSTGDIYCADSLKEVTKKFAILLFVRPLHATIKTAYHISLPISVPREIHLALQRQSNASKTEKAKIAAIAIKNNLIDIGRTPLYGLVLTVISAVGIVLGIFRSEKIYELRAVAGNLELRLNRGIECGVWELTICFRPLYNRSDFAKEWRQGKSYADTDYPPDNKDLQVASNIARAEIRYMRTYRQLTQCYLLWPHGVPIDVGQ